jgi:hypothetical protein
MRYVDVGKTEDLTVVVNPSSPVGYSYRDEWRLRGGLTLART